jgi:hypothetical protein
LSYRVSRHLEMIGVHLLRSQPAIDVLEHLLHKLYHLVGLDVVARLPGRVLDSAVFPSWVHLFLQRCYSVDQPVGGHADPGQAKSLQFIASAGQCSHQRYLRRCWFFHPCLVIFGEAADKCGKTALMIFALEPLFMSTLENFKGRSRKSRCRQV